MLKWLNLGDLTTSLRILFQCFLWRHVSKYPILTSPETTEVILSWGLTCYLGEETEPHLSETFFQGVVGSDKVPPAPPLLEAKHPQLSQPLLIRLVFQILHHLHSSLDSKHVGFSIFSSSKGWLFVLIRDILTVQLSSASCWGTGAIHWLVTADTCGTPGLWEGLLLCLLTSAVCDLSWSQPAETQPQAEPEDISSSGCSELELGRWWIDAGRGTVAAAEHCVHQGAGLCLCVWFVSAGHSWGQSAFHMDGKTNIIRSHIQKIPSGEKKKVEG